MGSRSVFRSVFGVSLAWGRFGIGGGFRTIVISGICLFITISFSSDFSAVFVDCVDPRAINKCVIELKMAAIKCSENPYIVCNRYPLIKVSIISFIMWNIISAMIIAEEIYPHSINFCKAMSQPCVMTCQIVFSENKFVKLMSAFP